MEILDDVGKLIGETIVVIDSDQGDGSAVLTLATESGKLVMLDIWNDGGILISEKSEDDVIKTLEHSSYLLDMLDKYGVFDLKELKKARRERQIAEFKARELEKENEERELYEKLKAKFEGES